VHSLKDLPTDETPGLCLGAVPERASPADVLVCREGPSDGETCLDSLQAGAVLGTGSLRRRSQLLHVRPDLQAEDVRGNVETRLRKLDEGTYDALVLAEAGLTRLGLAERISQILPPEIALPAVGQGALGLECRADDAPVREVLAGIDHPATHAAVRAERAMLAALRGGCLAPIAAFGRIEEQLLVLTGRVLSVDGVQRIEATLDGDPDTADELGRRVAEALLDDGAEELVAAARQGT